MREIVIQLGFEYPKMFREREGINPSFLSSEILRFIILEGPDGKRGVDKVDVQARKMCDRV